MSQKTEVIKTIEFNNPSYVHRWFINISLPNVVNIKKISSILRGKQCFLVPISYQKISITGSVEDIENETRYIFKKLATREGGLIAYNYKEMVQATREYGTYQIDSNLIKEYKDKDCMKDYS